MNPKHSNIILLNGVSSSGKSSLARALKTALDAPTIIMGIDQYMRDEIARKSAEMNHPVQTDNWWHAMQALLPYMPAEEKDDYFNNCLRRFYQEIKEHRLADNYVIVDMVLEDTHDFFEILDDQPILMILVYAPLHAVLKNLESRNASNIAHEVRVFASALSQYAKLFRPAHDDEPALDTLQLEDFLIFCNYLRKEGYWNEEKLRTFEQQFKSEFFNNSKPTVNIAPRLEYDLIVYTHQNSPQQCAESIKKLVRSIDE